VIGVRDVARRNNYYVDGLTHTWVSYYSARISSSLAAVSEWHQMEDIESHRPVELKLAASLTVNNNNNKCNYNYNTSENVYSAVNVLRVHFVHRMNAGSVLSGCQPSDQAI